MGHICVRFIGFLCKQERTRHISMFMPIKCTKHLFCCKSQSCLPNREKVCMCVPVQNAWVSIFQCFSLNSNQFFVLIIYVVNVFESIRYMYSQMSTHTTKHFVKQWSVIHFKAFLYAMSMLMDRKATNILTYSTQNVWYVHISAHS